MTVSEKDAVIYLFFYLRYKINQAFVGNRLSSDRQVWWLTGKLSRPAWQLG
jgi:hypothetical protein